MEGSTKSRGGSTCYVTHALNRSPRTSLLQLSDLSCNSDLSCKSVMLWLPAMQNSGGVPTCDTGSSWPFTARLNIFTL